jgi:hypothetical protein
VPAVCEEVAPSAEKTVAVICGSLSVFFEFGFTKENILVSIEMRMKCGMGGHGWSRD